MVDSIHIWSRRFGFGPAWGGSAGDLAWMIAGLIGMIPGAAGELLFGFRSKSHEAVQLDEAAFLQTAGVLGAGLSMNTTGAERELLAILDLCDLTQFRKSSQDLRISLLGWWLGQAGRASRLRTRDDVGHWR